MTLKNFKNYIFLLIILIFFSPLKAEDKIDLWKGNKKINELTNKNEISSDKVDLQKQNSLNTLNNNSKIEIIENLSEKSETVKVYGIHDPEDYNFNVNMWVSTNADDVRASINRLKKIKLSKTSKEILENILLSFSYPPSGMSEEEFVKLKVDWLIENNREDLIENFLKQNNEFFGKKKAVQYLVDKSISQANIKDGCKQIKFIDGTIKDSYLEKFKIYCLIFNNQKSQAQLLLDLLREQNQSDKFFDDKISFLLGITDKTSKKINEKNLLNFYLSSITINDFNYQPSKKTKKEIWQYLNSANLIKLENIDDKEKLRELELSANLGQIDKKIIFDIYKQIPFNLNTLINAKNVYQTLDEIDARALIYQKFLLSEDNTSKVEYLFLLEDLFKKGKFTQIYSEFLSNRLEEIGIENVPVNYQEIVISKIARNKKLTLGRVKYNDKILHQSKIIKFYVEEENQKKAQKEINKIFKKINKNKKYFYSAKDLALVDALVKDGFKVPNELSFKELASKYDVPKNLVQLIEKKQNAFLALKIVEIIGEDEPYQLDPETIYFITNLLNETDLIKIRNKVLISALPQRV